MWANRRRQRDWLREAMPLTYDDAKNMCAFRCAIYFPATLLAFLIATLISESFARVGLSAVTIGWAWIYFNFKAAQRRFRPPMPPPPVTRPRRHRERPVRRGPLYDRDLDFPL